MGGSAASIFNLLALATCATLTLAGAGLTIRAARDRVDRSLPMAVGWFLLLALAVLGGIVLLDVLAGGVMVRRLFG